METQLQSDLVDATNFTHGAAVSSPVIHYLFFADEIQAGC